MQWTVPEYLQMKRVEVPVPVAKAESVPQPKLERLSERIRKNKWDVDAWLSLLAESLHTNSDSRAAFDRFLDQFPTCAKVWIQYYEHELKLNNLAYLEQIFSKSLRTVLDVSVWKFYIHYIQRVHPYKQVPPDQKDQVKSIVLKAFEFCLEHVGMDKDSSSIWSDYLDFVKSWETKTQYEEQQKMDQIRKIFHRALSVPLSNIEELWKEYDLFENRVSKLTAKAFISEKSAQYMTSRLAYRELKILLEPLEHFSRNYVPHPPSWSEKECHMLEYTMRYLSWEKSNPLSLSPEDHVKRVDYAYEHSLIFMRHYPAMYIDAFKYYKGEKGMSYLEKGISANPKSLLLVMTFATQRQIAKIEFSEVSKSFESFIESLNNEILAVNEYYDQEKQAVETANTSSEGGDDQVEKNMELVKLKERELETLEAKKVKELSEYKELITLAYIFYMRLARRESEKVARQVFAQSRKNEYVLYHIYIASALMEYHCSKDSAIAGRVFELALKTYASEPEQYQAVVHHYLDFLFASNNDTNARALFEKAITTLPPENSKRLWDRMIEYENLYGELGVVERLEKRREDDNSLTGKLQNRFTYHDLTFIAEKELGGLIYEKYASKIPKFKSSLISAAPSTLSHVSNSGKKKKDEKSLAMESYYPAKFPRPDLNKYEVYKPDEHKPVTRPVVNTVVASPQPQVQKVSELMIQLPAAIARLLQDLTPSSLYGGPVLKAEDLLMLVRQLPIPVPQTVPLSNVSMDVLKSKKRKMGESGISSKRVKE